MTKREILEAAAWYGGALAVAALIVFPPLVRALAARDARRTAAEYTAGQRTLR